MKKEALIFLMFFIILGAGKADAKGSISTSIEKQNPMEIYEPLLNKAIQGWKAYSRESNKLISLGGEKYLEIVRRESEIIKQNLKKTERFFPPDFENFGGLLDDLFGKEVRTSQKAIRGKTLWLDALFKYALPDNSGDKKTAQINILYLLYEAELIR